MRKIAVLAAVALVLQSLSGPAYAAISPHTKVFKNCTELNKTYPGGVAKSKGIKNKGGATKKTPTVNAKLYAENSGKDRDKDGIACEK
jgi:hypothetical protein